MWFLQFDAEIKKNMLLLHDFTSLNKNITALMAKPNVQQFFYSLMCVRVTILCNEGGDAGRQQLLMTAVGWPLFDQT